MRILHIILKLTPTNGQYHEHCLPLMAQRDISICTYFRSDIVPPPQLTYFEGNNSLRGFIRTLRTALRAANYDVIHVHTPHAGVLLILTLLLSGGLRGLQPKTVHTVQNSFQNFKLHHKIMFIPSFAYFKRLVFCSAASYESFPFIMKWLVGERVDVVRNAVDLERIDRQIALVDNTEVDRFEIVSVGLIAMKNPSTVLAAFDQARDEHSKLSILGDGQLRPVINQGIESGGLSDDVTLTGLISRDSVFQHYARADLFVSASFGEGLPVAVLEAMACRCPVVLSDIPPHREIAADADYIPLVAADDVAGFAREMRRFQTMPAAQREAVGAKCRALVARRFDLEVMHDAYRAVYGRIIGSERSVAPKEAA